MKRLRGWRPLLAVLLVPVFLYGAAMATIAIAGSLDDTAQADVAVVLGNRIEADGRPSPRLQARLERARQLYAAGTVGHLIVSGGMGLEGFDEATVMQAWLVEHGVPAAAITPDHAGVNTWSTAANTARILAERGWSRAYAVSQYFHVPRVKLAMTRFGIPEVYGAHPRYFETRDLYSTFREVIAYGVYCLRRMPPAEANADDDPGPRRPIP